MPDLALTIIASCTVNDPLPCLRSSKLVRHCLLSLLLVSLGLYTRPFADHATMGDSAGDLWRVFRDANQLSRFVRLHEHPLSRFCCSQTLACIFDQCTRGRTCLTFAFRRRTANAAGVCALECPKILLNSLTTTFTNSIFHSL